MGGASRQDLFTDQYYVNLEGGILEAFGKLFTRNLRIYVYPLRDPRTGSLRTVENAEMPANVRGLYSHIVEGGRIKQLDNFDENVLHSCSRDVLKRIKEEDPSWVSMAPPEIAEMIKRRRFFGYQEAEAPHLAGIVSQ